MIWVKVFYVSVVQLSLFLRCSGLVAPPVSGTVWTWLVGARAGYFSDGNGAKFN